MTDNDNLFSINSLKVIILFLWNTYFWTIIKWIFLPYIVHILFLCLYISYIFEKKVKFPNDVYW
jgi:hypothetical protein